MHGGPVVRAPCAATAMRVKKNPKELSEQEKVNCLAAKTIVDKT